jgi:hypothetical protein
MGAMPRRCQAHDSSWRAVRTNLPVSGAHAALRRIIASSTVSEKRGFAHPTILIDYGMARQ